MTKLVQDKRPDLINVLEAEPPKELGLIPAWSYSALKTYETCAYRSYIGKVKKIQEDYGPAAAVVQTYTQKPKTTYEAT
jgi:hypothetical protein